VLEKILQKLCDFSGKGRIFGKKFENFCKISEKYTDRMFLPLTDLRLLS